jgi:hypothetical protein
MQLLRRGRSSDDIDVREAGGVVALVQLRNRQRREDCFVEANALREVARVEVDVVDHRSRPIPLAGLHDSYASAGIGSSAGARVTSDWRVPGSKKWQRSGSSASRILVPLNWRVPEGSLAVKSARAS